VNTFANQWLVPTLRWLLVPISVAMIVASIAALARWGVTLTDQQCAVEHMVGGTCVESWHTSVVDYAIYLAVIAIGLGVALVPASIAPSHRLAVAIVCVGLVLAGFLTFYTFTRWPELLLPLLLTAISGGLGSYWVSQRS